MLELLEKILKNLTGFIQTSTNKSWKKSIGEYKDLKAKIKEGDKSNAELLIKGAIDFKTSSSFNTSFALARDYYTRYACRKALFYAALDKNLFYNIYSQSIIKTKTEEDAGE